jgi:hypothetical protein
VERVWHQTTPEGALAVVYLEAEDIGQVFAGIASASDPFLDWWRSRIMAIHGLDLTEPLPAPPNSLVHDWSDA